VRTNTCPVFSVDKPWQLPSRAPSRTAVIKARCSLRIEADQRVIVMADERHAENLVA
jgi:hypothetical protein